MEDSVPGGSPVGLEVVTRLFWTPYTGTEAERARRKNNNNINNMLTISQWRFKEMQVVTGRKRLTGAADRQSAVQRGGAKGQVVLNSS